MYGKVKNIWDIKTNGGGSSIDTENFAKKNEANTFTEKNTFTGTGDIATFQTTSANAGGIDFKHNGVEDSNRIGYIGGSQNTPNKMTIYGRDGLLLQTPNSDIEVSTGNGATNDFIWSSTKSYSQLADNAILRKKDTIYKRVIEKTTSTSLNTTWTTNLYWTLDGLNTPGIHDILFVLEIGNNISYNLSAKIMWKNGVSEAKSQFLTISNGSETFDFQIVIKASNQLYLYHKKSGGSVNINWIRGWILREKNQPTKADVIWG